MTRLTQRKAAALDGRKRYSTGKPCKRGHYAPRYTASGCCVECSREQAHRRYDSQWLKNLSKSERAKRVLGMDFLDQNVRRKRNV